MAGEDKGNPHPPGAQRRLYPVWYHIIDQAGNGQVAADTLVAVVIADSMPPRDLIARVGKEVGEKVLGAGLTPGPQAWRTIEDLARAICVEMGHPVARTERIH